MKLTLNGMKRTRFGNPLNCPGALRFAGRHVRIWSDEHRAYWRPGGSGYTTEVGQSGVWHFENAYRMTSHCGREKRIVYETAESRVAVAEERVGPIRRKAYKAAAAKCLNAGDDCDKLCSYCRDMVDAALGAVGMTDLRA